MVRLHPLGAFAGLALFAAACTGPAAQPTPTTAPAKPTAAPAAVVPSPSAVATPAASPAAKPAASPAASPVAMASPSTAGRIRVISPRDGETVTSVDIPMRVEVTGFKLAPEHVGMPDAPDEGHIHVMHDGMNMGVLFNFYTTTNFTLPGQGLQPGQRTLIVDLATNTHEDLESTVQQVKINYQPASPKPAPAAQTTSGKPDVKIESPADGATVGPKFQLRVMPTNFTPSLDLEGKQNLQGYGHYHVFVDMDMSAPMSMEGGMMSMAGMVSMPGSNTIDVDLTAWPNGKHTVTVEPVQNDHTPIEGAKPAMITINLTGAAGR